MFEITRAYPHFFDYLNRAEFRLDYEKPGLVLVWELLTTGDAFDSIKLWCVPK